MNSSIFMVYGVEYFGRKVRDKFQHTRAW